MTEAPRVLFLSLTNDVGSDRIVGELGRAGARCAVLGPAGCFAGLSRCVERRFDLPGALGTWAATLRLRRRLRRAVHAWHADQVIPLDELAALLLRTVAVERGTDPEVRAVLVRSFGKPVGYAAACHRLALMDTAAAAGVPTPAFAGADLPGTPSFPLVVKRDHSSGSGGVQVVRNPAELVAALRGARLKQTVKRAMARAAGYRHGADPILLQSFVPGTLAMRTVVARDGAVLDGISFTAVRSNPDTRASTILAPIDSAGMTDAASRIVAALGCSGFVSFDFMVDRQGQPLLIEMNPRPIGSTHLGRAFGHDLARAFLTGRAKTETAGAEAAHAVALFPKELERDPTVDPERTPGLRHDVPWDEPQVVSAYLTHLARRHPTSAALLQERFGGAQPRDVDWRRKVVPQPAG